VQAKCPGTNSILPQPPAQCDVGKYYVPPHLSAAKQRWTDTVLTDITLSGGLREN
jgi:hypothetical protein